MGQVPAAWLTLTKSHNEEKWEGRRPHSLSPNPPNHFPNPHCKGRASRFEFVQSLVTALLHTHQAVEGHGSHIVRLVVGQQAGQLHILLRHKVLIHVEVPDPLCCAGQVQGTVRRAVGLLLENLLGWGVGGGEGRGREEEGLGEGWGVGEGIPLVFVESTWFAIVASQEV